MVSLVDARTSRETTRRVEGKGGGREREDDRDLPRIIARLTGKDGEANALAAVVDGLAPDIGDEIVILSR